MSYYNDVTAALFIQLNIEASTIDGVIIYYRGDRRKEDYLTCKGSVHVNKQYTSRHDDSIGIHQKSITNIDFNASEKDIRMSRFATYDECNSSIDRNNLTSLTRSI